MTAFMYDYSTLDGENVLFITMMVRDYVRALVRNPSLPLLYNGCYIMADGISILIQWHFDGHNAATRRETKPNKWRPDLERGYFQILYFIRASAEYVCSYPSVRSVFCWLTTDSTRTWLSCLWPLPSKAEGIVELFRAMKSPDRLPYHGRNLDDKFRNMRLTTEQKMSSRCVMLNDIVSN